VFCFTKNLVFIKIGQYQLKSQVLLAPMAGTSDKPFRMLCKTQGAALTTSEMKPYNLKDGLGV
jgi:tRNA-dihydrouridine synthase B